MTEIHTCKTCRYLERYTFASSGKAADPHDDYGFRCAWMNQQAFPWAEPRLRVMAEHWSGGSIGKRHVEGDWSESIDCPTWGGKPE